MSLMDAVSALPVGQAACLALALVVAFGFEFINGFHDTANAVATVIYTRTLQATPAVLYSGVMNFFGVILGGTGVAFGIVNLLPVDLLVSSDSVLALVTVLALLLAGVAWNLGTWYVGIPVSSSHTLIGSILGVGLARGLLAGNGLAGLNWEKVLETGLALLISPAVGFVASFGLLLLIKQTFREPRLYAPPVGDDRPPRWVRGVLIATCGGVSFAHGSNDGQKGMGLILLVLIGFLPAYYALNTNRPTQSAAVVAALPQARAAFAGRSAQFPSAAADLDAIERELAGKASFDELPVDRRWEVRQSISRTARSLKAAGAKPELRATFSASVEFVPLWVVVGVALALGIGTTVGYKRIVVTVAEKIGTMHLTYAQGAAAELVAASAILIADVAHAPVSTTQVLSSGIAGTMVANGGGVQSETVRRILLAWLLTLPGTALLAGSLAALGWWLVR